MKNGKILILGATGLLGQALMREGKRRDYSVQGTARRLAALNFDLTDNQALSLAVAEEKPKVIINCAANVSLSACENDMAAAYAINAEMPAQLTHLCRKHGIYLVQISTDHYYSGDGPRKHLESEDVRPCNEYSKTKFLAEKAVLPNDNTLVLRTNIVGFRGRPDRPTFVEWALQALNQDSEVPLFCDYFTSSIDVTQFSEALFDLVQRRTTGLLNLASAQVSSKQTFVLALAKRFGLSTKHVTPASVTQMEGIRRNESCGLDVTAAEAALGYRLPDLAGVIEQLFEDHAMAKTEG